MVAVLEPDAEIRIEAAARIDAPPDEVGKDRVVRGEAKLGEKKVAIIPPDPIGELGSGFDKIAGGKVEKSVGLTIGKSR